MDLDESDMTVITNHFGHSLQVHNVWYRREESEAEITRMGRILLAIDEGESVKRKRIDDLQTAAPEDTGEESKFCNLSFDFNMPKLVLYQIFEVVKP